MLKLMILDDHPLVRQGIRGIVSVDGKADVVGEASTVQEALSVMERMLPDLAIVDLNLGGVSGLEFIRQAGELGYSCKYLILTSSATRAELQTAQTLGVDGICLKEALPEDLLYAVDVVARGRKYYDPLFMDSLMDSGPTAEERAFAELTPKELEVLVALGRGCSNKDIARALYITEFTVKKHVSQILCKLNLADRTQAALYALTKGLVRFELASV
ncbi:response regulator [Cohnella hashimotonis]|uniref:Response regulator transcription factor n=1 Tax=Cohnella hashimotonis TaxID=2826895 RepID=A0ABT6TV84_9BACL|nr:response regulator transcription factor [Cohnella hashimotonis]MDI4649854.1 response regulator transcription factor [Cohnella hashimotonis]